MRKLAEQYGLRRSMQKTLKGQGARSKGKGKRLWQVMEIVTTCRLCMKGDV